MVLPTIRALLIYLWKNNLSQNTGLKALVALKSRSEIDIFWEQKREIHRLPPIEQAIEEAKSYEFSMGAKSIRLLTPYDEYSSYPVRLNPLFPNPNVIAVCGVEKYLRMAQASIVGSRTMLESAYDVTHAIVDALVSRGYVITSGGAIGIDAAAHRRAMARSAPTIVVSPGGPDLPGPMKNADIYEYARSRGAIVSQYPLGYAPMRRNFPSRNRIIAALSSATVIVHCREKSGALYTAQAARRLGIPVYVAAMRGMHPLTEGGLALVKQGKARLLSDVADLDSIVERKQGELFFFQSPGESAKSDGDFWAGVEETGGCFDGVSVRRRDVVSGKGGGASRMMGEDELGDVVCEWGSSRRGGCEGEEGFCDWENSFAPSRSRWSGRSRADLDGVCKSELLPEAVEGGNAGISIGEDSTSDGIRNILRRGATTRENLRRLTDYPSDFDEAILDLELSGEIELSAGTYRWLGETSGVV